MTRDEFSKKIADIIEEYILKYCLELTPLKKAKNDAVKRIIEVYDQRQAENEL